MIWLVWSYHMHLCCGATDSSNSPSGSKGHCRSWDVVFVDNVGAYIDILFRKAPAPNSRSPLHVQSASNKSFLFNCQIKWCPTTLSSYSFTEIWLNVKRGQCCPLVELCPHILILWMNLCLSGVMNAPRLSSLMAAGSLSHQRTRFGSFTC